MKPADIRRFERLIAMAAKFSDALGDAEMRGIVDDWKAFGPLKLQDLVNEFHDWQIRKLEAEKRKAST